ncbi:bacteriohemerythrin [Azospira inquinata]|uniref:Hemerythrin family protein n=1 Tax=Azospira inquinata TaxID=2785627 RepID=A0A975SN15_9RHOO|nr:bacteriohemerythrin [Azospira inquinata]QWT45387.1 hemerythrin family protein [Azospira inquinata]QWT49283.1 hemerythrin family protein [Azospira inquinata]
MPIYFPWSPTLSVGLDEIDAQHKLLVDIINRVYQAMIDRAPRASSARVLDELVQYTAVHFAVEESLFRMTDYPGYEGHKAQHERLKREVMQIREDFAAGRIGLDLHLMAFLKRWLENHICREDKTYVGHLLKSGIKAHWNQPGWVGRIWSSLRA